MQVEEAPHAVAVTDGSRRWSYDDLNRKANRLAHRLLDRLGETADPVAMLLDVEADMIAAIYGTLKAGKFYVALDPESPPARLRSLLEETGAEVVITNEVHRELAETIAGSARTVLPMGDDIDSREQNPTLNIPSDQLAYVIYTSGSTGVPKGVMHTHETVLFDMRPPRRRPGRTRRCRRAHREADSRLAGGVEGDRTVARKMILGPCGYPRYWFERWSGTEQIVRGETNASGARFGAPNARQLEPHRRLATESRPLTSGREAVVEVAMLARNYEPRGGAQR